MKCYPGPTENGIGLWHFSLWHIMNSYPCPTGNGSIWRICSLEGVLACAVLVLYSAACLVSVLYGLYYKL